MVSGLSDGCPPLISIITPCLNRAETIGQALASVSRQTFGNFEHIVVDGGSGDGTPDIVSKYAHAVVVSEPDENLYDAINKGISRARGRFIVILNADDILLPRSLALFSDAIDNNPGAEIICGDALVFRESADGVKTLLGGHGKAHARAMRFRDLALRAPVLNAKCISRSVYDCTGMFNTLLPVAADRLFLMQAALRNPVVINLRQPVYAYRLGEQSLTIRSDTSGWSKIAADHFRIVHLLEPLTPRDKVPALRLMRAKAAAMKFFCLWQSGGGAGAVRYGLSMILDRPSILSAIIRLACMRLFGHDGPDGRDDERTESGGTVQSLDPSRF